MHPRCPGHARNRGQCHQGCGRPAAPNIRSTPAGMCQAVHAGCAEPSEPIAQMSPSSSVELPSYFWLPQKHSSRYVSGGARRRCCASSANCTNESLIQC
eukprot:1136422-Pelagomonas_calceolata.AAC.1